MTSQSVDNMQWAWFHLSWKGLSQLTLFMWSIFLHQVCLYSMQCLLIQMYWAKWFHSSFTQVSQLYVHVSFCFNLQIIRWWLSHGHVICMNELDQAVCIWFLAQALDLASGYCHTSTLCVVMLRPQRHHHAFKASV